MKSASVKGEYLDGREVCKLNVPANSPVARFWAVTAYDATTRGLLDTGGNTNNSIGSADEPVENAEGSVDIYFGPTKAPKSKEKIGPGPTARRGSLLCSASTVRRKAISTRAGCLLTLSTRTSQTDAMTKCLVRRSNDRKMRGDRISACHARITSEP